MPANWNDVLVKKAPTRRKAKESSGWYISNNPAPSRIGPVVGIIGVLGFSATTGYVVRELHLNQLGLIAIPMAAGLFWGQVAIAYRLYELMGGKE